MKTRPMTEMCRPLNPERGLQRRPVRYADVGAELVPCHAVVPYEEGHALLSSLTSRLTAPEDRMTHSETAFSQICKVQDRQINALETVQQNIAKLTDTLAGLNLAMLRNDVVGAVRDLMRQESVTCPGPPPRAQPSSTMPEPREEARALPARASAAAPPRDWTVAGSGDGVWSTFDCTMPVR